MAGVAGDVALSGKVILVYSQDHLDHLPSCLFWLLVIAVECVFDVTVLAAHAERLRNELHRRNELIGGSSFQHLDIFVDLFCRFGTSDRLRLCPCTQDRCERKTSSGSQKATTEHQENQP